MIEVKDFLAAPRNHMLTAIEKSTSVFISCLGQVLRNPRVDVAHRLLIALAQTVWTSCLKRNCQATQYRSLQRPLIQVYVTIDAQHFTWFVLCYALLSSPARYWRSS